MWNIVWYVFCWNKVVIIKMYCRWKSEKVIFDVMDLIDIKNGLIKFSIFRDSISCLLFFNYFLLER